MHDQIKLWNLAASSFDTRHDVVEADHMNQPTPCDEFDVVELIDHAIGTQIWFGGLLGGNAAEGAPWAEARSEMAAALETPGVLDGDFDLPSLGSMPKAAALAIATNDLLIHSWDLARAIGVDDTLPAESVEAAIIGLNAFPPDVKAALFANGETLPEGADAQTKMLNLAGRTV